MSIGIGINEAYGLNPHIEEIHHDAAEAVHQMMNAFESASGADALYRRIADEAMRNVRAQFEMKPDELISTVVRDFKKVLETMTTNALIALAKKVQKYMHLTDTEKTMAETVDETVYHYICEHLNDDDVYVEMKKVYDHFIAA